MEGFTNAAVVITVQYVRVSNNKLYTLNSPGAKCQLNDAQACGCKRRILKCSLCLKESIV